MDAMRAPKYCPDCGHKWSGLFKGYRTMDDCVWQCRSCGHIVDLRRETEMEVAHEYAHAPRE